MRGFVRYFRALLLTAAFLVLLFDPSHANVFEIFGAGSKATAMGGAYSAIADDFSAAFYNPAGVTQSTHVEFTTGLFFGNGVLEVNGKNLSTPGVHGAVIGLIAPIFKGRGGLGLAGYIPQNSLLAVKTRYPFEPHYPELQDNPYRLTLHLGLGFEIKPTLSIGVGFHLLSGQDAVNEVFFPVFLGNAGEVPGAATIEPPRANIGAVEADIRAQQRIAPTAGILWKPFANFRMGLGFRSEIEWPLRIRIEADNILFVPPTSVFGLFGTSFAANGQNLLRGNVAAVPFYSPHQVDFDFAYEPVDSFTVAAGFRWSGWRQFEDSNIRGAFDETIVQLRVTPPFEASHARINFMDFQNPEFIDVYAPHVGMEARLPTFHDLPLYGDVDVALRFGYSWVPTCVRDNQGGVDGDRSFIGDSSAMEPAPTGGQNSNNPPGASGVLRLNTGTNFVGADRHIFSAGLGIRMKDPLGWAEKIQLDGHIQYHMLSEKSFDNAQYFPNGSGVPGELTIVNATREPILFLPDIPTTPDLVADGYLISGGFTLTLVF